jgi:hypothetical protein
MQREEGRHYGDRGLGEGATTTDMSMLIAMRQPDANGNLIPNYVQPVRQA